MEFSFYLCPRSSVLPRGDALGQLVKCYSSKSISKPKFPAKPDLSRFLTGFQKPKPDMSGPSSYMSTSAPSSSIVKSLPDLSGPYSGFQKVELDMSGSQARF
jgi:hypothetical protein